MRTEGGSITSARDSIAVSFEFFPAKNKEAETALWESINRLASLRPNFVSVTCGAGGSTQELTLSVVNRILIETSLKPAAHLTCVAGTRAKVDDLIRLYHTIGVRHIVALRGDPISGLGTPFLPCQGGYGNSAELVAGIKRIADMEVSVSAYPEKHPHSPTVDADIQMLKAKVDAGASRAITQFFFENSVFFRYLDRVRARGISIPIVPGIMPINNLKQVTEFAVRCGASVPGRLVDRFEGLDSIEFARLASLVVAEQLIGLIENGVTEFHFYTMNRAGPILDTLQFVAALQRAVD
jgi:methylenetetrahydrofolate reductase (NADPH)